MASWMFFNASSRLLPSLMQPGRLGTTAVKLLSSLDYKTTRTRMHAACGGNGSRSSPLLPELPDGRLQPPGYVFERLPVGTGRENFQPSQTFFDETLPRPRR